MIGLKFGKLTVIKKSSRKGLGVCWFCKCDCGNIVEKLGTKLRHGDIKTCGCSRKRENLIGRKFGFLKVESLSESKRIGDIYNCKCDCGKIVKVYASNLKSGNTRSCGCMSAKLQEETNLQKYGCKSSFQNISVKEKFEKNNLLKYGCKYPAQNKEIALKTAKSSKNSFILYHWKTGEEIVCVASYEKAVVEYLNKNKIDFKWQHRVFKVIMKDGSRSTYRPDLYLIGKRNPWIEIKGYFREDAKEKWEYFHNKLKPNSELWDKEFLIKKRIL